MSDALVITRPDGVVRRIDGYRFEEPSGDAPFSGGDGLGKLPDTVDLRAGLNPVQDHGEASSCVAHAVASAFEHLRRRHLPEERFTASRLFVYFNARAAGGTEAEDEGSSIPEALAGVKEHGAASAKAWPFEADRVVTKPDDAAYEQAKGFVVDDVARVEVTLDAFKKALAAGHPIVFGLYLYESFDRHRIPGLVPVPSDEDIERDQGEHTLLCVGYCDADEVFIVRNSWGPAWGDQGYCYIPYAYMMDTELNRGDAWVLLKSEALDPDKSTWSDGSVLEDSETAFGAMDDATWSGLVDAVGDVSLETRLALIFLAAAEADADIPDGALSTIASALDDAYQHLGSPFEADPVLRAALSLVDEGALIDDSIVLIGEHFEEEVLVAIVKAAAEAAELENVAAAQEGTIADLVDSWLGGAAPRDGGLVDGLPGEYDDVNYAGGVYGDEDEDDFGGFGEVE